MSPESGELPEPFESLFESVRTDRTRGAMELTLDALRELDRLLTDSEALSRTQWKLVLRRLAGVRPAMASLAHTAGRLAGASPGRDAPSAVKELVKDLESLPEQILRTARREAPVPGFVCTISRSSRIRHLFQHHPPETMLVPHSVPGGEGLDLIRALENSGLNVRFCYESELPRYRESVEEVWVGADRILPERGVVNKVGTELVFQVFPEARHVVVSSTYKLDPLGRAVEREPRPGPQTLPEYLRGDHPTFELVPWERIDVCWTERGPLRDSSVWEEFQQETGETLKELLQDQEGD